MRLISIQIGGSSLVERQWLPAAARHKDKGEFQSGKELISSLWEILAFDNVPASS